MSTAAPKIFDDQSIKIILACDDPNPSLPYMLGTTCLQASPLCDSIAMIQDMGLGFLGSLGMAEWCDHTLTHFRLPGA